MRGRELTEWRRRNGYDQKGLMNELEIGSRQTISSWENSKRPIPRTVVLALTALERLPDCRNIAGKKVSSQVRTEFLNKVGRSE
jgi:transcriptional regulator with XRE-family HTH domain